MESLKKALHAYTGTTPSLTLGAKGITEAEALKKTQRDRLHRDLREVRRKNEMYFRLGMGLVVLLFIAMLGVAFLQLRNPAISQAAPPLFGGTALGVVWGLFRVNREKHYTDCILALVPNVDDETLKTIVAVLVTKL